MHSASTNDVLIAHQRFISLVLGLGSRVANVVMFPVVFPAACPRNTFYRGRRRTGMCVDCPINSHTNGPGKKFKRSCKCNAGFRGIPAIDVDCQGKYRDNLYQTCQIFFNIVGSDLVRKMVFMWSYSPPIRGP